MKLASQIAKKKKTWQLKLVKTVNLSVPYQDLVLGRNYHHRQKELF